MIRINQQLLNMLQQIGLNDAPITTKGPISSQFLALKIPTLYAAIDHVYRLAYTPPSEPFNYKLVLSENCGTCSTKHALLAALAIELQLDLKLGLAIYNLTPDRFPMLSPILQKYKLAYIPESHNFLVYNNSYLDITFPRRCELLHRSDLIDFKLIKPNLITEYKANEYQKYMTTWLQQNASTITMDQFKDIHEQCLKQLFEVYSH